MVRRGDHIGDLSGTRPVTFAVAVVAEEGAASDHFVRCGGKLRAGIGVLAKAARWIEHLVLGRTVGCKFRTLHVVVWIIPIGDELPDVT